MPDPNNPIFFPELNGTDGSTCGVYAFGFTSGCTDDNNINRGFTQEWYYDGSIGAWVSVTVGVTGGGADFTNAGATYTAQRKSAPKMTGSGLAKKYAYLDPDTGALTFDYINTFEIVNPEETQYTVNDFEWLGVTRYDHAQDPMNPLNGVIQSFTPGVTLCGPIGHTFEYTQDTSSSPQFRFYINRRKNATSGNTLPSPFAPVPNLTTGTTIDDVEYVLTSSEEDAKFTVVNINGDSTVNIPMFVGSTANEQYYSGESGEVKIRYNAVNVGFTTAGGPLFEGFRPKLLVDLDQDLGTTYTAAPSIGTNVVRHENWIYTFIEGDTAPDSGTGVSGDNFRNYLDYNGIKGASGERRLIDPLVRNPQNSPIANYTDTGNMSGCRYISFTFTPQDYGAASTETTIPNCFVYFAIPTRVDTDAERDLRNNGEPTGWANSDRTTIGITNEFGYFETYHLYRTVGPSGVPANGMGIDLVRF